MKISMIAIGKNEAATLPGICDNFKALSSELNGEAEFIFVDSDSSDNSMSIVVNFKKNNPELNITTTEITGNINAAMGRNEGLKQLNPDSEYIFFLDADIIFEPQFVYEAISVLKNDERIGTVTGTIYDCYDNDLTFIRNTGENAIVKYHGGNFIIRKKMIASIGYFDESLVKHQDIDYTFRIRNKGYLLKKIGTSLGCHHTTHYLNLNRVCSDLKKKKYFSTGILFRKYIFTEFRKDMLFSGSVKGVILRLFLICLLLSSIVIPYAFFVWAACMCVFLSRVKKKRGENILARLISMLTGLQFIIGVFMIPKKDEKLS